MACWNWVGVGSAGTRFGAVSVVEAAGTAEMSSVAETADVLAAAAGVLLPVCGCIAGAEEVLTVRAGLALVAALVEARAEWAADDELLDAEELLGPCPDSPGAAVATAAHAPEVISKPAPTANPKVVIRPTRLMDVTPAPAHITANQNCRPRQ
ncbi:hypothetical protein MHPYR_30056 [uncultured Mycobacterium sp.]|uniref:Uncharacterized protein n=1 Tax=uncultured Mycobacterium sp. TaxID=171292 RepID=A0A1Y5PFG8_9MYCO|nr:hypothetical protein MHPYR_30056 [uncultured Mycobacterium sp.]